MRDEGESDEMYGVRWGGRGGWVGMVEVVPAYWAGLVGVVLQWDAVVST